MAFIFPELKQRWGPVTFKSMQVRNGEFPSLGPSCIASYAKWLYLPRVRCAALGPGVHSALIRACPVKQTSKLLSYYATNRDQVGFCRQVINRHACRSRKNLALLCLDRAATVQTYWPTAAQKNLFDFSVSFHQCSENALWSMQYRLGKRRIDRSMCKQSS